MQIRLFQKVSLKQVNYLRWDNCPLCGGVGVARAALKRSNYRFGRVCIPLPRYGVDLLECQDCSLLFKSAIPDAESLANILSSEAVFEWKEKAGDHPSLPQIRSLIDEGQRIDVLDVGASNGDLLRGLAPFCNRLSAFDVVRYPACEATITGEYIRGSFEEDPCWSGDRYDIVTAFDVFEHFLEPPKAIKNLVEFLKPGGQLIIETGNWQASQTNLGEWYYCNLFEHQIFWSRKTFDFLCDKLNLVIHQCETVNHKYRRDMPAAKRAAISLYRQSARPDWLRQIVSSTFGVDPRLLPRPMLLDHLFIVFRKK